MAYITLTQLADRPGAVELAQVATPRQYRQVDAELEERVEAPRGPSWLNEMKISKGQKKVKRYPENFHLCIAVSVSWAYSNHCQRV